ncbi:hypothetical protein JAAARDRAFT_127637 [Jaapia argillacea MUCL 33604]|uniref:RNB domain-containing protein n=1 Tax=Jaapia argillacea MUCL 33604 TaxID=933084 RepID=A0A067Q9U0_9AGAM|nr:hypothetical protein JAAARDRAFT_127637 [Jaapia argillacea MUCL 33604]
MGSRHLQENRLAAAIGTTGAPRTVASQEKSRFFAPWEGSGSNVALEPLEARLVQQVDVDVDPGAFVELRRNGIQVNGIVIFHYFENRTWRTASLTSTGELWEHKPSDIMFTIPNFVERDLPRRCGQEEFATSPIQLQARARIIRHLRDFEKRMEQTQAAIGSLMGDIYPLVCSPNPDAWSSITTDDVVRLLKGPNGASDNLLPLLFQLAVHKFLMSKSTHFVAVSRELKTVQTFDVRPQSMVENIKTVTQMAKLWLHGEEHSPITPFAKKAKEIIALAHEREAASLNEPPSVHENPQFSWTKDDLTIIKCLYDSVRKHRHVQDDPYTYPTTAIVKAMGMVDTDRIGDPTVAKLLMDLGVFAPWQDLVTLDPMVGLDPDPVEKSSLVQAENALTEKGLAARQTAPASKPSVATKRATPLQPLGPEDFYPSDPLSSIRHDFGNLPVYVIDDPGAEELDDGISIEPHPSSSHPNCHWVHIHIADPTSLIPPTHTFAIQARQRLQTQYFAHRTFPMLPKSVIEGGGLSLGGKGGEGENVLTFSVLVDGEGNLAEYKVRAGIVRDVRCISYDQVDKALGAKRVGRFYPFGGAPKEDERGELDEETVKSLKGLNAVARRLQARMLTLPVFQFTLPKPAVTMTPKPSPSSPSLAHLASSGSVTEFRGFPNLSYGITDIPSESEGSRGMVSELMKVAGRAASLFCTDHDIPAIRRHTPQPLTPSDDVFEKLLKSRNSQGFINYFQATGMGLLSLAGQYSVDPVEHWTLGIPEGEGYCRATSPLRRFIDMTLHYQIKDALLLKKLGMGTKAFFDREWMQGLAEEVSLKERRLRRLEISNVDNWAITYVHRWLNHPSRKHLAPAEIPGPHNPFADFKGVVAGMVRPDVVAKYHQTDVHLPALGVMARLIHLKAHDEYEVGDVVDLKLDTVTLGVSARIDVVKR